MHFNISYFYWRQKCFTKKTSLITHILPVYSTMLKIYWNNHFNVASYQNCFICTPLAGVNRLSCPWCLVQPPMKLLKRNEDLSPVSQTNQSVKARNQNGYSKRESLSYSRLIDNYSVLFGKRAFNHIHLRFSSSITAQKLMTITQDSNEHALSSNFMIHLENCEGYIITRPWG